MQKSVILDEFVAATDYARKYAIQLLAQPPLPMPAAIRRPRAPRYGPAVQAALETARKSGYKRKTCADFAKMRAALEKLEDLLFGGEE
jgi:hypothetical protein